MSFSTIYQQFSETTVYWESTENSKSQALGFSKYLVSTANDLQGNFINKYSLGYAR